MISVDPNHTQSAYGGSGWQPRTHSLRGELGNIWSACGIDSEYQRLTHVLLHRPGTELEASANPDAVNMLEPLDLARAQAQHDALADVYRAHGITVTYAEPAHTPTPNQMFMADVFVMTPEGAIVARPASQVRAGEERIAARRLSDIGVPILRSINNRGTFEGADLMWLDPQTAIVGRGLRTNDDGAAQIEQLLTSMGIRMIKVDLPFGSMHLMGMLRIVDRNLAIVWPSRFVHRGVDALRERGFMWQCSQRTKKYAVVLRLILSLLRRAPLSWQLGIHAHRHGLNNMASPVSPRLLTSSPRRRAPSAVSQELLPVICN